MANNNNIYKLGATVEASSDEEGFKGAYYVATIIENPKGDKCLVEYHIKDENLKNLTEVVHVSKLRPLPPVVKMDEIIEVHDFVDAYHSNGWWKGEVMQLLVGDRFLVNFDTPPQHQLALHRSHLRIHLDWVDGEWVKPSKKNNEPGASDNMTLRCSGRPIQLPHVGNNSGTPAKKTYTAALIRPSNYRPVTREFGGLSEVHVKGNRNEQTRDQVIIIENVEGSKGFGRNSIRKGARPRKFVAEEHFSTI